MSVPITKQIWAEHAARGTKEKLTSVASAEDLTASPAITLKPKKVKRYNSPKVQTTPRTTKTPKAELKLNGSLQLRKAYQEPWLNNFEALPHNLTIGEESFHFASKAIVSFPGSGLTTTLAAKALETWRRGEAILILAEHDHSKFKIAQTMLDLANPEEKEKLQAAFGFDHREQQAITIINPTSLLAKPTTRQASNSEIEVAQATPESQPVEALNPNIKHIFIDEVNKYAGNPEQTGRAKLIIDLLKQTHSTETNPTEIYGVSSTPKISHEEEAPNNSETKSPIDFTELFPNNHVIEGISHGALKQQGFIRDVKLQALKVATNDVRPSHYGQLFGCKHEDETKTTRVEASSPLVKLANIIKADNKTRIMTHTARAADDLAKILCIYGHQASSVSSYHKGHYQLVQVPTEEAKANLEKVIIGETTYYLKRITIDENQILNSFENDTGNNIIIDYQILNGHDSPKVDTLIFFNGSTWEPKMLRALGQSASGSNSSKPLTVMHCEFTNADQRVEQSIQANLNNILTAQTPWWSLAVSPTISSGTTTPSLHYPEAPIPGELKLGDRSQAARLTEHKAWIQEGLEPIYQLTKGKEQYLTQIKNYFREQGKSLNLDVLYGKKKDPEHFAEIITYNQKLLARLVPGHHIYSNPESYQIHVASIAPSLVKLDVQSDDFAKRLVENLYQKNNSDTENSSTENAAWLKALDKALNIHPQANDLTRVHYRASKFAEVLHDLYGPEFFCFPTNIETALQVFTGQTRNRFLLTYLAQSCISDASELDKLKAQFPSMFASNSSRSFADLKASILAKYPEPPPEDSKKEFFTQTLYQDLNIDLVNLMNAAILATQDSQQIIKAQADLRSDISQFLQGVETNLFTQERSLINNEALYQAEIQELVNRHLDPITQEILFNQLTHKIWQHADIRTSMSSSDHRLSTMSPDTLRTEALGIKANDQYEAINLLNANKNWLEFITQATNTMVDLEALSGLKIGAKVRLMTVVEDFWRTQSEAALSPEALNLLCGIESPANENDRELIRSFVRYINQDINKAVSQFPDRLGVLDLSEANLVVTRTLSQINTSGFNQRLAKLTNNATTNLELIAEFLFTRDPDALLDPDALDSAIKLINGEARGQGYLRSYISFLESRGLVKLGDIIVALPKLTGLYDKDELIAAIKTPGRFDLQDAVKKPGNQNIIDKVDALAKTLGLEVNKMAELLGVPNPEVFYREPIISIAAARNTSTSPAEGEKILPPNISLAILSREIIKAAFGEEYRDVTDQEIPTLYSQSQTNQINSSFTHIRIHKFYSNRFVTEETTTTPDMKVVDQYETEYKNHLWTPLEVKSNIVIEPQKINNLMDILRQKNQTWFTKLTTHCNRSIEDVLNTLLTFKTQLSKHLVNSFDSLVAIAFGDEAIIKQDPNGQEIFRQWVQYIGMNLDEVIAEFPKLTGVRDATELKQAVKHAYPNFRDLNKEHETRMSRSDIQTYAARQEILKKISNLISLDEKSIAKLLGIDDNAIGMRLSDLSFFAPALNQYLTQIIKDQTPTFRRALILEALWDDTYPQYIPIDSSKATHQKGPFIYLSSQHMQSVFAENGKLEYNEAITNQGTTKRVPQPVYSKLEQISIIGTADQYQRAYNDKTSAWLDLLDKSFNIEDARQAVPIPRAIAIANFMQDRYPNLASQETYDQTIRALDIVAALSGERDPKEYSKRNIQQVSIVKRTSMDQILRSEFITYINEKAQEKAWNPIPAEALDTISSLLPNRTISSNPTDQVPPKASVENIKAAILKQYPTYEITKTLLGTEQQMKSFLENIQQQFNIDINELMRIFDVTTPTQFGTLSDRISKALHTVISREGTPSINISDLNQHYLQMVNQTKPYGIIARQILGEVYPELSVNNRGFLTPLSSRDNTQEVNSLLFQKGKLTLITTKGPQKIGKLIVAYNLQADGSWEETKSPSSPYSS